MNTTLRMRISYRTTGTTSEAPALAKTTGGAASETRAIINQLAQQKRAQLRRRRLKRGAWLAATALGVAGLLMVRHHRAALLAHAPRTATPVAAHVVPATPVATAPAAVQSAPVNTATTALAAAPAPLPLLAPPAAAAAVSEARAACDQEFSERRWKTAVDSCTAAYEAEANPAVALKIAQANWSRGRTAGAGTWATRAVETGSEDADAYVLIGHAARKAGHLKEAMAAYRRYLQASPHGWHAHVVRATLRELKSKTALGAPTTEPL